MRYIALILPFLLCCSARAATITAASTSLANVQSAVNLAVSGDTVVLPPGSSTWSSPITITKQIAMQGAGTNLTVISNGSVSPGSGTWYPLFDIALSVDGPIVVHDIFFKDTSTSDFDSLGIEVSGTSPFERQVKIYNCAFQSFRWGIYDNGGWGVCYNCTFYNNRTDARIQGFNVTGDLPVTGAPYGWASTNAFVFEDCEFNRTGWTDNNYNFDTEFPAAYIIRNCVFRNNLSGSGSVDGLDMHGENQSGRVPISVQCYSNRWVLTGSSTVSGLLLVDFRGGANGLAYSNVLSGLGKSGAIRFRDDPVAGVFMTNTYAWANSADGGFTYQTANGVTIGVDAFTNGAPSGFTQLTYPHPLRGALSPDTTPPSPNPPTLVAIALGATSVSLTATNETDATLPVSYFFHETTLHPGSTDSGWIATNVYVDTGLAANTNYTWQVKVRDSAVPPNETAYSTLTSVTTAVAGAAVLIPADRRVTWQGHVGIPGGIPTYAVGVVATNSPYFADPTGVTNATTAINNAITACSVSNAVYLPPGVYRVNGTINMKARVALRGAGPTLTLLNMGDDGKVEMLSGGLTTDGRNISAGLTKDSTVLTIASTSGLAVGDIVLVDQTNDTSYVTIGDCDYCSRSNGTRLVESMYVITSISGNDVSIDPPLAITLLSGQDPEMVKLNTGTLMEWAGVEDLKTQQTNEVTTSDGNVFELRHTKHCWLKNVEIYQVPEYGAFIVRSFRGEFRHNYIHHGALNDYGSGKAYGLGIWWGSSWNLFEDNICYYLRHSFTVEGGGVGNVWGYNYSDRMFDAFYPDTDYIMGDLLLHGAHPMMNLYEGNVARVLYFDNVHGSGSVNTAFRNWLVGESQGEVLNLTNYLYMDWGLCAVGIDENHLSNNIVANVLGGMNLRPTGLNKVYDAQTIAGINPATNWYTYILGQSDRANLGTAPGWSEVTNKLLRHLNWDPTTTTNSGVRFDGLGIADELTAPDSLYLTNKPAWFGFLPFPPFDPYRGNAAAVADIPAGFRFLKGFDPPTIVGHKPVAPFALSTRGHR